MLRLVLLLSSLFSPLRAFANRQLDVDIGTDKSIVQAISDVLAFLAGAIGSIAVALFVAGAFMVMIGGAKEDQAQKGKDLIIGSLLSLAVVLGAYAMLRTVDWFLS